jgi:predicted metal-dependent peptidase
VDSSMTDVLCYLMSSRVQDLCGRILSALERRESKKIPMMAIAVRNRHYVLLYNPDWIAKAHYDDVVMTVRHEAYHIIFEHIPRHIEAEANIQGMGDLREMHMFHTVSPFASDLAANSLLIDASGSEYMREHRNEWVLPGFDKFKSLLPKEAFEWYVRKLTDLMRKHPDKEVPQTMTQMLQEAGFGEGKNDNGDMFTSLRDEDQAEDSPSGEGGSSKGEDSSEEQGEPSGGSGGEPNEDNEDESNGGGSGDSEPDEEEKENDLPSGQGIELLKNHRGWSDEDLEESPDSKVNLADELRYQGKAVVKHAVEEHQKSQGTMPSHLEEAIAKLLKEPQVPWTRIFRNIAAGAKRTRRKRSIGRPRRRHIGIPDLIPFPGKKKDYSYHIAFCIDTSGSMGSPELEMGLNELEGMRKLDKDMTVTVIECDAAVERTYELGSEHDAIKYSVTGRGGTSFDPALLHAQQLVPRPDAVFYFTDGFASAPSKESRVPCLFAWIITPSGKIPDEWGIAIRTKPYV